MSIIKLCNKKIFTVTFILLLSSVAFWNFTNQKNDKFQEVILLHVNDFHSHFEKFNDEWLPCKEDQKGCFGGISRLSHMVSKVKEENQNVIFLSAGDEFQGSKFYTHYKGQVSAHFMNKLQYDAMVLGNHEFDDGPEVLEDFVREAKFPVLSGNLKILRDHQILKEKVLPYTIIQKGTTKFGIIGVTTPNTSTISKPGENIKFEDVKVSINKSIKEINQKGVNKIILLTHLGLKEDKKLASEIKGVQVIVGGHSHSLISNKNENHEKEGSYPIVVKSSNGEPILIVTAFQYSKYLGFLKLRFQDDKMVSWDGGPIILDDSVQDDLIVKSDLERFAGNMKINNQVVAVSQNSYKNEKCFKNECSLGNLLADSLLSDAKKRFPQASIALFNAGGIRTGITQGNVDTGDLKELFPFNDYVSVFDMKGEQLQKLLLDSVYKAYQGDSSDFLHVAGIRFKWCKNCSKNKKIINMEILNEDKKYTSIKLEKYYTVAAPLFLTKNNDFHQKIKLKSNGENQYLIIDALIRYVKNIKTIDYQIEGRIIGINSTTPNKKDSNSHINQKSLAKME